MATCPNGSRTVGLCGIRLLVKSGRRLTRVRHGSLGAEIGTTFQFCRRRRRGSPTLQTCGAIQLDSGWSAIFQNRARPAGFLAADCSFRSRRPKHEPFGLALPDGVRYQYSRNYGRVQDTCAAAARRLVRHCSQGHQRNSSRGH